MNKFFEGFTFNIKRKKKYKKITFGARYKALIFHYGVKTKRRESIFAALSCGTAPSEFL